MIKERKKNVSRPLRQTRFEKVNSKADQEVLYPTKITDITDSSKSNSAASDALVTNRVRLMFVNNSSL